MNLKEELESRWLLNQFSSEDVFDLYSKWWESFYIWFDPSADSLQLGNMCAVMAAVNLMRFGNKCYFLVGWATWMIWDPGWKDAERNFLTEEVLRHNEKSIHNQLKRFLENLKANHNIDFDFEMVNNYDFYKDMPILDFLRDVGKYITINNMIKKETVVRRIEDPDKSISYTEFSYMLLQGYDFVKLYRDKWVKLQLAWGDQWWNAVTGVELIRKIEEKEWFVMTIPIVTDASWKKFWKSAWNAVWLDSSKNSPYFVYQFFMNVADADIERYMKILTLKDLNEISSIMSRHNEKPELRYGQNELAKAVVEIIFGKNASSQAEMISEMLFWNADKLETIKSMTKEDIEALSKETWSTQFTAWIQILDALVNAWLATSRWEWRKLIEWGWIFFNETKVEDWFKEILDSDFINWSIILRKWKKNFKLMLK
ncbi:MAG: Tyrosyl-tRNA synthetase [uncultured bacterium (gcode 4)]|uniref:Tyrosine--tRNA ligase n=1 Tax=uncultured bacterium (gcode 4) TaxID=1234023 RepID=K2GFU5_9BACT|nr:MAG: Tyrosyl-tRNA synthetase [uncultured bacterium (gcode 4)]